jgi:hypothetical protein
MRTRHFVLPGILIFVWTSFASLSPVSAQDDVDAARRHYSKATRLYEVGEYHQALDEFKAAHVAKPDPAFLYNIAQCHRQLGDSEQAVTLYKRYLVASPNAANRAEVERRVAEIESDLATRRSKGAAATQIPPAPEQAPMSPGTPSAPANSPPAYSPPATPTPPTSMIGSPAVVAQPVAIATVAQPQPAGSSFRYLRWVGIGVTAALAGGAIVAGLSASSKFDDLKKTCGATDAGCADSAVNGVKSRALLTNVLWGAAGVAAVGTGVAFYLTPHESAVQMAWRF